MKKVKVFSGLSFALGSICLAGALSVQSAQAATITFDPGTYYLAETNLGPAVDTLVVTVSGGTASFVLSGMDNATFSVPDGLSPSGNVNSTSGYNPYFYIPGSAITASWDSAMYPYLTFYSTADFGGFSASEAPGDKMSNIINTFPSTAGTAQFFGVSGVPEPTTWVMMIAGFGIVGASIRLRRGSIARLPHLVAIID